MKEMSTIGDLTLRGKLDSQNVLSLAKFISEITDKKDEREVELSSSSNLSAINVIFFYASWNDNNRNKVSPNCSNNIQNSWNSLWALINDNDDISTCINHLMKESASEVVALSSNINMSLIQVDQDETCMSLCIGDNPLGDDDCIGRNNIHCPANLPAIAVLFGKNFNYVSMQSSSILQCLQEHSHQNCQQFNISMKILTNAIATTISNALNSIRSNLEDDLDKDGQEQERCLATRIFIAGDRSKVGKSSVCLGLLGSLLKQGYPPSSLAYIKPATQCENTQLVTEYCKRHGITACRPIGPLLYYKGFTRAFLNGQTEDTNNLLQKCAQAVDEIAQDKQIVLIDGVGYPSVGSICGTDNASMACACGYPIMTTNKISNTTSTQRLPVPTLIVGKSGVGDAIDSYNLNATYMKAKSVPVIGGIFNRLSLDGFYSLESCKKAVTTYFQKFKLNEGESAFGFIPEVPEIAKTRDTNGMDASLLLQEALENADTFVSTFEKYVDVGGIINRAQRYSKKSSKKEDILKLGILEASKLNSKIEADQNPIRLTREQIEEAAKSQGAAGG